MSGTEFPFAAIVGQEDLKKALLMNAVDPTIGGVLVKGPRGTGKSTTVRGLAELLPDQPVHGECTYGCAPDSDWENCPDCSGEDPSVTTRRPPLVEFPLGSSIEQVTGSIDLERAVSESSVAFQPGLLARAHRGILYVDEVNLLADRLVDVILDAAASGWNRVERDGISFSHPSRFMLVGTMNPEEGRLRPQLKDRFGLCVEASNITDPDQRMELSRRVRAFDRDPEGFRARWQEDNEDLAERIRRAREQRSRVKIPSEKERRVAERVLEAGADGHRADVVILKTATALASWDGRDQVNESDVDTAARWALEHRGTSPPPGPDRDSSRGTHPGNGSGGERKSEEHNRDPSGSNGDSTPDPEPMGQLRWSPPETSDEMSDGDDAPRLEHVTDHGNASPRGSFDPYGTLKEWARNEDGKQLRVEHLCFRRPIQRDRVLTFLLMDASASMRKGNAIGILKGALIRSLCAEKETKQLFGIISFRHDRASLQLPPTSRIERVRQVLEDLPTGGDTPILEGLRRSRLCVEEYQDRYPRWTTEVVALSDGRVSSTETLRKELRRLSNCTRVTLVDAEIERKQWGCLEELARDTGTQYQRLIHYAA